MDKLTLYRRHIRSLLERLNKPSFNATDVDSQMILDRERDHYLLLDVGWEKGSQRVFNCYVHLDIKDGKIWIQRNMTEVDLAEELAAMGVPKQDIVLGLHSPYKRQFTEYAAA